ncbi:MAG: T9SS type A sorting domain-containing protein, partial [Bacteroidales bacterium]|nr:T9SS type A sorting domain-containing protein [Bacteroidales bacterium]
AKICEILETTAVKLSDKKSNQTGSGRIDVVAAVEAVTEGDDEENISTNSLHDFNIFPNPVEDNLIITTEAVVEHIIVYDMYGRHQVTKSPSHQGNLTIDVSDLNSGAYFVKITTDKGESTKLFIKK